MVAAAEQAESAGNDQYQNRHMASIFKEGFSFSGFERDYVALGLGGGRFLDVSGVSGLDSISDGRGSVFADFDNDGDADVFLTTAQGEAHFLFRNNVGSQNGFLRVELQGTRSGPDAYGAVVRVKTSLGVLTKIKAGGSGYLSQHDPRLLFGLGDDPVAEWVEVTWPGGEAQRYEQVPAGTALRVVEGREDFQEVAERRFALVDPLSSSQVLLTKLAFRPGELFPDLALRTLDDESIRLSTVVRPGKRYLINLWATYCVPCNKEMPELQKLQPRLDAAGIGLLGLSLDLDTADQIPDFLESRGIHYPIYVAGEDAVPEIFSRGEVLIPLSILIDDRRRVIEVHSGWSEESRRALRELAGLPHAAELGGSAE